jgi:RHS repeat-associated protein
VFIREGEERSRQNIKIRIGKADSQWDKDSRIPSPEYAREPLGESLNGVSQDTKNISSYQEGITSSRANPKGSIIPLGSSGVTYYIHSYDGKVLAEYDQNGNCVRDYIYVVDLLRAEYRPLEGKYYYYTSDQVNSVRVVTVDAGNAVYVAAYSPYGKIQEEWVPTYQPSLKFSGKERETNSEVDYFGARYYNHKHYRFLSVDPVINRDEAISNPQLWNLYSFCRNNPITFFDPDGRLETSLQILDPKYDKWQFISFTRMWQIGNPEENVDVANVGGKYSPRFKYHAKIQITLNLNKEEILEHEEQHVKGYEWLYGRNVGQFKQAEERTFKSREEATVFGIQFFENITSWRPFKWKLHDPSWLGSLNIIGWFTHKSMWNRWAKSKNWD